tara:strand:- start:102 stop:812 length:711 start_codon:yes stop_codon:yes gene_type:complete
MSNLKDSPKFNVYDDYYTPKFAWEQIAHLIPDDKVVWEAFLLNSHRSKSIENLKSLGKQVVGNTEWDYFEKCREVEYDLIVSNPPFDKRIKIPILKKLVEVDKPFILIMNSMNTFCKYFCDIFRDVRKDLQIITPYGKINFEKLEKDGTTTMTSNCSFYCVYVCYKMNIPQENLFLDRWILPPKPKKKKKKKIKKLKKRLMKKMEKKHKAVAKWKMSFTKGSDSVIAVWAIELAKI